MLNFRRRFVCKQKKRKASGNRRDKRIYIDPKYPSTRTYWYHNKTSTIEWEEFSDIDCEIIENAFKNGQQEIEFDSSVINLKYLIMTIKNDKSKQYPIKRMEYVPKRLRQERFCPVPENVSEMNDGRLFYYGIDRAKRHFFWSCQQEYFCDMPQSVEQAAAGILIEGEKLGYRHQAQWIANNLLEVKYKTDQEIGERCIALYTRESFLYKLINKTLRDDDLEKHQTLSPFAYLLGFEGLFNLSDTQPYTKIVYRAMNLTPNQVNQYEVLAGDKQMFHWKNFASTTKSLVKAEFYGTNTLFYITLSHKKNTTAVDITTYSYIPDEEEVLLSHPFYFQIESVIYDNQKKLHNIYLRQYSLRD